MGKWKPYRPFVSFHSIYRRLDLNLGTQHTDFVQNLLSFPSISRDSVAEPMFALTIAANCFTFIRINKHLSLVLTIKFVPLDGLETNCHIT